MINIQLLEDTDSFPKYAFGLGQDVSQNLINIIKVPSLFVVNSKINQWLINGRMKKVAVSKSIANKLLALLSLKPIQLSMKQLQGSRTKGKANGLVQALYDGQGHRACINNWAAMNYVSMAVSFGLLDINYHNGLFFITKLGKQAVNLYDKNSPKLQSFMLQRLYAYPYACWLLRFANKWQMTHVHGFNKFDLGAAFGFLDDSGFLSLPKRPYELAMYQANKKHAGTKEKSKIRSNYESTSDKYMRWLAGVLCYYNFLTSQQGYKTINGVKFSTGKSYQITLQGMQALRIINGKSRYPRSTKRVRWEFFGPKANTLVKTRRALILKVLNESNSLSAKQISSRVNGYCKRIKADTSVVIDDIKGFNQIGVEIKHHNNKYHLEEPLDDFIIPIADNDDMAPTKAQEVKKYIRPRLKKIPHQYLMGIDIAFKPHTSNSEDRKLEIIATDLFTNAGLKYHGKHLGGPNRPDGYATDGNTAWVIDAKAYHKGYTMVHTHTDEMQRYLSELDNKNIHVGNGWWKPIANTNSNNQYYVYVSSMFSGDYLYLNNGLKKRTGHNGGMLAIGKLLLIAEEYQENKVDHNVTTKQILDNRINFNQYSKQL